MSHIKIDKLIKEISNAIKDAQIHIENYALEAFQSCFMQKGSEKEEETACYPKMIKLPIPNSKGEFTEQDIPIVSLLHHHALFLDEVKLKLRVSCSLDTESENLHVNIEPTYHKKDTGEGKEVSYADIELLFKRGETTEGISKIMQKHYNTMV
jgi:hypothetical protein